MALAGRAGIRNIEADLSGRQLVVVHDGDAGDVTAALTPLNLGVRLITTTAASEQDEIRKPTQSDEVRTLKAVLVINATMFAGEVIGALLADSSALLADSLDMFADAAVYGIALFGVHQARSTQLKAAHVSGILQLLLAVGALAEVIRRMVFGSQPDATIMIGVAVVALAANATSMWLLAGHRGGGAHMKASWIFTTNDVIANLGVIAAAVLVRLLKSPIPDLVVATLIALVVLNGAIQILRLKAE